MNFALAARITVGLVIVVGAGIARLVRAFFIVVVVLVGLIAMIIDRMIDELRMTHGGRE